MTIITKDEFDNLPAAVKAEFKPEGDGFVLFKEDVSGLKKSQAQLLKEKKELEERFAGLDPDEYKALKAAQDQVADEKLKAAGEFDKLREQLETRHKIELEKARADHDSLLHNLKRESLKTLLTSPEIGVLPDRVKGIIAEGDLENVLEFVSDESGFRFKKKGGIGDEAELKEIFTGLKEKATWGFASNITPGSGALGSGNANGGQKQDLSSLPATARLTQLFEQKQ